MIYRDIPKYLYISMYPYVTHALQRKNCTYVRIGGKKMLEIYELIIIYAVGLYFGYIIGRAHERQKNV